jgi:hypothetical protein
MLTTKRIMFAIWYIMGLVLSHLVMTTLFKDLPDGQYVMVAAMFGISMYGIIHESFERFWK